MWQDCGRPPTSARISEALPWEYRGQEDSEMPRMCGDVVTLTAYCEVVAPVLSNVCETCRTPLAVPGRTKIFAGMWVGFFGTSLRLRPGCPPAEGEGCHGAVGNT